MELGYPVNDYRGYLAHASNVRQWAQRSNVKYTDRIWTGKGWRYIYDEPRPRTKTLQGGPYSTEARKLDLGSGKPIRGESLFSEPKKTDVNKIIEKQNANFSEQKVITPSRQHDLNEFRDSRKEKREGGKSGFESVDKNLAKELTGDYRVKNEVQSAVRPYVGDRAARVAGNVVVGAQNAPETVAKAATKAGQAVAGAATGAYNTVSQAIVDSADWIKNFGEEQGRVFDIEERFENGETIEVKTYANTIAGNTARIANDIVSWVKQSFSDVSAIVLKGSSSIKRWVSDTVGTISDFYTNQVRPFVNGIITQIKNSDQYKTITGAFSTAFGAIVSAAGTALSAIGSAADSVAGFAADIFNGFGEILGITGQVNDALNAGQIQRRRAGEKDETKNKGGRD